MNVAVFIALSDDSSRTLLQIRRSPRTINIVQGNQLVLDICACAHLLCRTKQYSDLAAPNLFEKLLLLHLGIGFVNKAYLTFGNAALYQLRSDVSIDRKFSVGLWC